MPLSVIGGPGGYVGTEVAALGSLTPQSLARLLIPAVFLAEIMNPWAASELGRDGSVHCWFDTHGFSAVSNSSLANVRDLAMPYPRGKIPKKKTCFYSGKMRSPLYCTMRERRSGY